MNYPDLVRPLKILHTSASKHYFRWALNSPTDGSAHDGVTCFRTSTGNEYSNLSHKIDKCFANDFLEEDNSSTPTVNDMLWESRVASSIAKRPDNFLEVCLPFKRDNVLLPNKKSQVYGRIKGLKTHLNIKSLWILCVLLILLSKSR